MKGKNEEQERRRRKKKKRKRKREGRKEKERRRWNKVKDSAVAIPVRLDNNTIVVIYKQVKDIVERHTIVREDGYLQEIASWGPLNWYVI